MTLNFIKKNKEINKVVLLPLEQIKSSPGQPRKFFDENGLEELAQSICMNGLLQPITVRKDKDGAYELIAGERRTLAYKKLGYEAIPAIIEDYSSEQSVVLTLIENLQRKDLNYFEEAAGIARLMQELHLNQQQVSEKLGKAQSTVANKLRLLKYPEQIQRKMLESEFSERHARALLKIQDEKLLQQVMAVIIKDRLNVEQTEQLVESFLCKPEQKKGSKVFIVKDMRMFLNSIQKAVATMNQAGIPVNTAKTESDSHVEVHIKIPKAAIYRDASPRIKATTGAVR